MAQLETQNQWKIKFLVLGALLGALAGLATAYLMARTAEENSDGPPEIKTLDALKASVNLIGLIRGIAALGKQ